MIIISNFSSYFNLTEIFSRIKNQLLDMFAKREIYHDNYLVLLSKYAKVDTNFAQTNRSVILDPGTSLTVTSDNIIDGGHINIVGYGSTWNSSSDCNLFGIWNTVNNTKYSTLIGYSNKFSNDSLNSYTLGESNDGKSVNGSYLIGYFNRASENLKTYVFGCYNNLQVKTTNVHIHGDGNYITKSLKSGRTTAGAIEYCYLFGYYNYIQNMDNTTNITKTQSTSYSYLIGRNNYLNCYNHDGSGGISTAYVYGYYNKISNLIPSGSQSAGKYVGVSGAWAIGYSNYINGGNYNHAFGTSNTITNSNYNFVFGYVNSIVDGGNSGAHGCYNQIKYAYYTYLYGYSNKTNQNGTTNCLCLGNSNVVDGSYNTIVGNNCQVDINSSYSIASGCYSHIVNSEHTLSDGIGSVVYGNCSRNHSNKGLIIGDNSVLFGETTNTQDLKTTTLDRLCYDDLPTTTLYSRIGTTSLSLNKIPYYLHIGSVFYLPINDSNITYTNRDFSMIDKYQVHKVAHIDYDTNTITLDRPLIVDLLGNSTLYFISHGITGDNCFVTGVNNISNGNNSSIFGKNNMSNSDFQAIFGCYNDNKDDSLFEIGNGVYDEENDTVSRSNAFSVDRSGNAKANDFVTNTISLNEVDSRIVAIEDENAQLKENNIELRELATSLETDLSNATEKITVLEGQMANSQEKVIELETTISELQSKLLELQDIINNL